MTLKPRTIDDLGVEPSVRYAKDQKELDTRLVEESRFVPLKTEVVVTTPYVPSEYERLFSIPRQRPWAQFSEPPATAERSGLVFTHRIIPSLGGYEKQEADLDKLEGLEESLGKQQKEAQPEAHEEQEAMSLVDLMRLIVKLEKALNLINARRNQYQRG
jgi:hypothetical protein